LRHIEIDINMDPFDHDIVVCHSPVPLDPTIVFQVGICHSQSQRLSGRRASAVSALICRCCRWRLLPSGAT
jgi:hypothetical protein